MLARKTRFARFSRMLIVVAGSVLLSGCAEKESAPELVTLEGKVEKIERTSDRTGTITVRYYSDKHKQELSGSGNVTEETEILINGVAAGLADLKEGDHVRGDVRIEKKGGSRTQTAVRIRVERAQASP